MAERQKSPPWDRRLREPKLRLPAGATDCHFHFIGPQELYPLRPNHVFAHLDFEDDTIEDWLKLQKTLGLSRGIHVLSMMYKHGYELMLHSLCRFRDRLRGVVCPHPSITDGELEVLTRAGVRGARFAHRMGPSIDPGVLRRSHEQGWSAHYLLRGLEEIEAWRATILASPGRFCLEHMGLPPTAKGVDSEEFRFVRECLDTGRCWLKLSPRISAQDNFPFSDASAVRATRRRAISFATVVGNRLAASAILQADAQRRRSRRSTCRLATERSTASAGAGRQSSGTFRLPCAGVRLAMDLGIAGRFVHSLRGPCNGDRSNARR